MLNVNVIIRDRITNMRIDWYTIDDSKIEKELEELRVDRLKYKDCDIIIDGIIRESF